ncbi:MAG: FkbM family methyltransferase [Flavobacteriales bacterium]|nr:FkbM family methyltransferase [Flavobacteriales bacterium]
MAVRTYCSRGVWYALRALTKLGVLRYLTFSVRAMIMGRKVRVPVMQGHGPGALSVGEPWGHALYTPLLDSFPGTFIDVGVNLGQTLTRVRITHPDLPYLGFEPNPICVQYSRELVRLNGFRDSPIVPAGLADRDGVVDLVMNNDDLTDSGASIVQDFRPGLKVLHRVTVTVLRFTSVERDLHIGKLGVVKIDVEGAEREVLLSMEQRISSDRPAIVLEILPVGRPEHTDRLRRQQDIEAFFARLDYRMVRIHNKGASTRLERMAAPIGIHNDQQLANFVVLPAERCEEMLPLLDRAIAQQ